MAKSARKPLAVGQKNLFSFFSTKPKPTNNSASAAPSSASAAAAPAKAKGPVCPPSNPPVTSLALKTSLLVWWPADEEWYKCHIAKKLDDGRVELVYDDGEVETVKLEAEVWKLVKSKIVDGEGAGKRENEEKEEVAASANAKRRRIMESSDESCSMEDADDDDSFKCDLEDSDEESFHADEEEEEEEETPKPKAKSAKKPASKPAKVTVLTPKSTPAQPKRLVTKTPSKSTRPTPANLPSKQLNPAFPIKDAVNPPGTHLHNHLSFFTNRKDLSGHTPDHPDFSPYNMRIDWKELETMCSTLDTKVSPAQRQWWEIKAQYANCVLLFKTGKFYEMFHDDADVAAEVLGHSYMKGVLAHAGFPEGGYDRLVGKLVDAGYRVARVEQTESAEALVERKRSTPRGVKKPEVVAREVCAVLTRGTRTFCYLEDVTALESGKQATGTLIAIKEMILNREDTMETDEDSTPAVCEYGVTIVDAITGTVTLGQFADDALRSRMQTLLSSFAPLDVIVEGGEDGASKSLLGLISTVCPKATISSIGQTDNFPKSFAILDEDRRAFNRPKQKVHPWSVEECIDELHRKGYYPRASKNDKDTEVRIARWPDVLRACVEGEANLALSSFGAALFSLQCNLIDNEILSMGIVKAYIPPNSGSASDECVSNGDTPEQLQRLYLEEARRDAGVVIAEADDTGYLAGEASIDHLALDGTTLSNLEILHNMSSGSYKGSLLSKIDFTKSPHGSRLLRAWLLRPLFKKAEIDRRADAVAELSNGAAAMAMGEVRNLLKRTGDIERLLSRVHSMSGSGTRHPDERAVFYESEKHTQRKVGDFSKLLKGLQAAAGIPEKFDGCHIQSPLLANLVRTTNNGGFMPADLNEKLDWFFDNFDVNKAAKGEFEPLPGMSEDYDNACEEIETILGELDTFQREMSAYLGHGAKQSWKYINTKEESKDKYLIELPVSVEVPDEFQVKGKRGKGNNQVNKYRCPEVERLVKGLERAIDVKNAGKALGMKLVFAKFDDMRDTWKATAMATAMLDAIGALATLAAQPGFCRPAIIECLPNTKPGIKIVQGRHPCVDATHNGGSFIPNDLILGGSVEADGSNDASILLLSGPNMGGKSTLLRQTCLITILAQIGSFVPAEECSLTPIDRIFTRLGASDRILCGQSTFFVELAETAAAVRGATRRSLVIMDELGRGTSTFDGTAIASATVKHLVERSKCLTMFATHYHSLLEDWKNDESICLGHMECIVEEDSSEDVIDKSNITFLYTLGAGPCPKSFGVNVARLAGLPDDVLRRAKNISAAFEAEMKGETKSHKIIPSTARSSVAIAEASFSTSDCLTSLDQLQELWKSLQ